MKKKIISNSKTSFEVNLKSLLLKFINRGPII